MHIKLPEFVQKWNFPRLLIMSAIIFVIGLFFGVITPKLLKLIVTSVSEDLFIRNWN